jgi:hypothetical protein
MDWLDKSSEYFSKRILIMEYTLPQRLAESKKRLLGWESKSIDTTRNATLLKMGDKHESVYQAFRAVTFFACACMDDINIAAKAFGPDWQKVKLRNKTNRYRQPIDFAIVKSGVDIKDIKGNDTVARWGKVIKDIHPQITDGTITYDNLIDVVCNQQGGIRAYYDRLTNRGKGKPPTPTKPSKPPKANSDCQLVVLVFDIKDSKSYPTTTDLVKIANRLPDFVTALDIDDDILAHLQDNGNKVIMV